MSASVNNLTLVVNQQDSNGTNVVNRTIGAITYSGSVGEQFFGTLGDTAEHQQTFPQGLTTALQVYIKNTHASAKITVAATPSGGAKATIMTLGPGATTAMWQATATGVGWSALYLTSDTASATFEAFIGG